MTRLRVLLGLAVLLVVVAAGATTAVVLDRDEPARESADAVDEDTLTEARDFLGTYVDPDGRVVRSDQGGDTVSEGQSYAMLLAVGSGDRETFERVWSWTRTNLLRPDGLVSWRWADGAVVDESSAADADLDIARALALAGERFDEPAYADEATRLGSAILDHETVETDDGLVLVAGQWATTSPSAFNPSYVSPVATSMLAELSSDPRWDELTTGSRAAVEALTVDGALPPDWAEVSDDGSVRPVPGPAGAPVVFGYDAARTLVRHAESCDPADRSVASDAAAVLGDDDPVAVYDLAGSPQTGDASPLMLVAQAAGRAADGDVDEAREGLRAAASARVDVPTYYGDAWAALGPMLLAEDVLGSCAPADLEASR